jgi:hypothetical protein
MSMGGGGRGPGVSPVCLTQGGGLRDELASHAHGRRWTLAMCGAHSRPIHITDACAQVEGDKAFLQRVGRADLLPKVAAARAAAAKEDK